MKRIGNSLIIIILIFNIVSILKSIASIKLEVLSTQNFPLESTSIGLPFIIQANAESDSKVDQKIEIENLENFKILNVMPSFSQLSINGKVTYGLKNNYIVQADNIGEFEIGPAKIKVDNKYIYSNIVKIKVDQKVVEKNRIDQNLDGEPQYYVTVANKNIFLGEKVNFKLNFKFDTNSYIRLHSIQDPEMANIKNLKIEGPTSKQELIDNKQYQILQWSGEFYPIEEGILKIPVLKAIYRHGFQLKEAYSQSIKISVKKLPPTDKEVNGIGRFQNLKITLDKEKIYSNSAAVMNLTVESSGNLDNIKAPKLNLPEFLKYYESTYKVKNSDINKKNKLLSIEYIIQAEKPGIYAIGKQAFTFFDVVKNKYITLTSNELQLEVQVDPNLEKKDKAEIDKKIDQDINQIIKKDSLQKLCLENNKYKYKYIPWFLYLILCLIPLLSIALKFLFLFLLDIKIVIRLRKKIDFIRSKILLKKAQRDKNINLIYKILQKFIINLIIIKNKSLDINSLLKEDLHSLLINYGISRDFDKDLINKWTIFVNSLLAPKFNNEVINFNDIDISKLFGQAYNWVNIIYKKN